MPSRNATRNVQYPILDSRFSVIEALYILSAAAVLAYVFIPLFQKQGEVQRASNRESRRRQLLEERERTLEAIRELDFDFRMGKLEDDDYRKIRSRYEADAIAVIKKLDEGNGRADPIEDLIEQEIAAVRRARKGSTSD